MVMPKGVGLIAFTFAVKKQKSGAEVGFALQPVSNLATNRLDCERTDILRQPFSERYIMINYRFFRVLAIREVAFLGIPKVSSGIVGQRSCLKIQDFSHIVPLIAKQKMDDFVQESKQRPATQTLATRRVRKPLARSSSSHTRGPRCRSFLNYPHPGKAHAHFTMAELPVLSY